MNQKFLTLTLLSMMMMVSCSEDENNLSSENAAIELSSIVGQMGDDVVTMIKSNGTDGAVELVKLLEDTEGLGRVAHYEPDAAKPFIIQKGHALSYYFATGVARTLDVDPDDITTQTGIWEWNNLVQNWVFVEESDILIVRFPAEGSSENNAEFRLVEYEEVLIDFEEYPTVIDADLSVDGEKVIDLDFNVNYADDGFPETADVFLDVIPFSFNISFDDTEAISSSFSSQILLEGENITGIELTVDYETSDKIEPVFIEGEVSYRSLSIEGSLDIVAADNSETGDPSDALDLDVLIDNEKIGDIIFVEEDITDEFGTYTEYVPYIQYGDGSREKLEDIFNDIEEEIEDVLDEIEAD